MPAVAQSRPFGLAFAPATSSAIEVMPEAGVATNTFGDVTSSAIGAKSFAGSYGTRLYRPGLTTRALDVTSSV